MDITEGCNALYGWDDESGELIEETDGDTDR